MRALYLYKEIIAVLESKDDFSDAQISLLQSKIFEFANDWTSVAGEDGMTNYFHYMIGGHVVYFARKYKN